jgi:hypothetical protein
LQKKLFRRILRFSLFSPILMPDISKRRLISKKNIQGIVANCLQISNLLSEVRLDDAELLFFGVKNVPKFQHFAALAIFKNS